ncbi:TPM domain-containing protein [Glacieibacterium sp.]|uniref:TPM domain-containing protein n=1 Tax=Glacieibacterium sp. TaxID=2860237 RepID=UPI003B0058BB
MSFTDADRTAIAGAIAAAELHTSGEIVCIVNEGRHRYTATGLTVATLLAFALPLAAVMLGFDFAQLMPWRDWSAGDLATDLARAIEAYAVVQVLIFVIVAALTVWTGLGAALTPRAIKRDRVHAEAMSQFRSRGIGRTRARTGVLIYVAMPDHIAEVVADEGIYAKVAPEHWGATIAALISGLKAGEPGRGFVAAVELAGSVLAEHFPPELSDNPNELPDRLIEL